MDGKFLGDWSLLSSGLWSRSISSKDESGGLEPLLLPCPDISEALVCKWRALVADTLFTDRVYYVVQGWRECLNNIVSPFGLILHSGFGLGLSRVFSYVKGGQGILLLLLHWTVNN